MHRLSNIHLGLHKGLSIAATLDLADRIFDNGRVVVELTPVRLEGHHLLVEVALRKVTQSRALTAASRTSNLCATFTKGRLSGIHHREIRAKITLSFQLEEI